MCIPAAVIRLRAQVEVPDMLGIVERVHIGPSEGVRAGEWPAVRAHTRGHDADTYEVFQALKLAHDERTSSPCCDVNVTGMNRRDAGRKAYGMRRRRKGGNGLERVALSIRSTSSSR